MQDGLRVGVTGSSGLVGTALCEHLAACGHAVIPIVRRTATDGEIAWDPTAGRLAARDLQPLHAVVHLAGAGIGDRRWSAAYKHELVDSRVAGTRLLAERLAELGGDAPDTLISGSAIGCYGDRGDERLTETSSLGDGFLADICRRWEASTEAASAAGVRVTHIRTGIVLSSAGGALKKMLPLFKLGLGGRFGNGRQWMSWISIIDQVRAIEHLLTGDADGPVNLTAPNPVRNREFADTLGDVLRRPSRLPVPAFGPRLLLGSEMADALLFDGQRVEPGVLTADGFEFDHADLTSALRSVLAD